MTQQPQPLLKTNYEPYRFNKVADFGVVRSVENPISGTSVSEFSKSFSLHYFQKKFTITQKIELTGLDKENSIIIVTRHDERLKDCTEVKINNTVYDIDDLSSDNSMYISFDLLTIVKSKKVS